MQAGSERNRYGAEPIQASSLRGFSISGFMACMKLAASHPSTTR
jgi:hypothetical protein